MKPFLGFIVLTGPLFLVVLWIPVCIALSVWVSLKAIKRKNLPLRIGVGFAVFLIAFVLPFGDEIAGRIYLKHLCETKAGAKVYQTIELPAKYWDEDGMPKFMESNGEVHWEQLSPIASTSTVSQEYPSIFSITDRRIVVRNHSGETSGEVIVYMFWGGWLIHATSASNSAVTCDGWRNNEFWSDFYKALFQREKN